MKNNFQKSYKKFAQFKKLMYICIVVDGKHYMECHQNNAINNKLAKFLSKKEKRFVKVK